MRDLQADKAICEKATPGPWELEDDVVYGLPVFEVSSPIGDTWIAKVLDTPKIIAGKENAEFIAAAREGWPHAIERAIAAEAELLERNGLLFADIEMLKAKLAAAEQVIEAARELWSKSELINTAFGLTRDVDSDYIEILGQALAELDKKDYFIINFTKGIDKGTLVR